MSILKSCLFTQYESLELSNFKANMSFLKIFNRILVKSITVKYIKKITIGDIILPTYLPISIQALYNGINTLDSKIPSIKNINDKASI